MTYGVYRSTSSKEGTDSLPAWQSHLAAWQTALPDSVAFTHLTAARIWGWWLPPSVPHQPLFAAMPNDPARPRRAGLLITRHTTPPGWDIVAGIRVTRPAETLLAAARDLGILDLVVLGDSALRNGDCTTDDIAAAASAKRRGAPLLRRVLPMLDARSESPWESVMRVLHRAAEINVEPQHVILDDSGRFVARADLWLVGTRRINEYDGAGRLEARQHVKDLERDRALIKAGRSAAALRWVRPVR